MFIMQYSKRLIKKSNCQHSFVDIYKANLVIDSTIDEIIKMDVIRSFTKDKEYPRDKLRDVLKCTAIALNEGVGYCQGMNYVAGMFFYILKDEEEVFKIYTCLIENKMSVLFTNKFEKLKAYFYVLDNLITLFIPDLAKHFKVN